MPEREHIDTQTQREFKRPPLSCRTAQITALIPGERFDMRLPQWIDETARTGAFNERKAKQHWSFRVDLSEGTIPLPKAIMTQSVQLSRATAPKLMLEASPPHAGQEFTTFQIVQEYSDEHPTSFADFHQECQRWLPHFLNHFEVDEIESLSLSYRNEITKTRYPSIWPSENTIQIAKLLHIFAAMPNPANPSFRDPFLIEFTRNILDAKGPALGFRLGPEWKNRPFAWVATITYTNWKLKYSPDDVLNTLTEFGTGHDHITTEFRNQFTEDAFDLFQK